jgi:hypothetical protein
MVDPAIRARSIATYEAHLVWALQQIAAGVDGPAPEGSPDPTDYNQHVPDLEASGEAEDAFAAQVAAIMGA